MKPLYIWAGGKNKMIPKYQKNPGIPYDTYDTYIEPFFGGGAMMIHIHENAPEVKRFVLNDINPEIVGIYTAIKHDTVDFIARMDVLSALYLPLTKEQRKEFYYVLRDKYTTDWQGWSATEESATLYFLMKTGFNGIWQTNLKSNGRYATPSGLLNHKTKVYDKDNVLEWEIFLQKVDIQCGNWDKCVATYNDEKAFYFMDPPYIDSFTSYGQIFNKDEQLKLLDFCKKTDIVFFCNRDDGSDIWTANKGDLNIAYYDITYTAGRRATDADGKKTAKKAVEVLLHSDITNVFGNGLFTEETLCQ